MIVFIVSELLSMVFLNNSNGVDDIKRSYLLYLGQTQCFNNSSTYSLHQVTLLLYMARSVQLVIFD